MLLGTLDYFLVSTIVIRYISHYLTIIWVPVRVDVIDKSQFVHLAWLLGGLVIEDDGACRIGEDIAQHMLMHIVLLKACSPHAFLSVNDVVLNQGNCQLLRFGHGT